MSADEGLHQKVFNEFLLLEESKNVSILILGAGEGAFDQRLIDYGFDNIMSIDVRDYYKAKKKKGVISGINKNPWGKPAGILKEAQNAAVTTC